MRIEFNDKFIHSMKRTWDYISLDSINNANKFRFELQEQIDNLVNFPYKFRKSYYYDDENTRDLIFKGYTIPYLIDEKNSKIIILDIFKWNKKG